LTYRIITPLCALLCATGALSAQSNGVASSLVPPPVFSAVNDQAPAPPPSTSQSWFIDHGRDCDGCPWRRPGHAFLQATYVNVIYGLANIARGQVTGRITPKTWWANMQQGWVWDLDEFVVNQFGHPYQGSNYFNAGRANGLSFWESAAVTAFGSGTWEYFGETNHASLNDFINTTMGGIALGEMFHRAAWLVRDPQKASGKREIIALLVDPVTGINRYLSGDAGRTSQKPEGLSPSSLGAEISAGALWQESDTLDAEAATRPFAEMDLRYGEPLEGRSRTPYDAFILRFRLGGGAGISEARVRGRLVGQPIGSSPFHFAISQSYDFTTNGLYRFGAQGLEGNISSTHSLSRRSAFRFVAWGGVTVLGAVDSLPLNGVVAEEPEPESSAGQGVSEGPRHYDYGPGWTFGGRSSVLFNARPLVSFEFEGRQLYVVDGERANHFLHRTRLDLQVPLKGALGIGATAEYFGRATYYHDVNNTKKTYYYPQFGLYLTWVTS
jgi:hypothetical protein